MADDKNKGDEDPRGARRRRSIAIGLLLGAMVVMFYLATMIRMGGNVINRPM